jgi:hypothetical protein
VLARWHDFVGTGEFFRALEQKIGWLRDRIWAAIKGEPKGAGDVAVAVESGLEALLREEGEKAAERAEAAWRANPAGRMLLDRAGADLRRVSEDYPSRAARAIRAWQGDVMELVSDEGSGRRTKARIAAFGVNGVGVALMLVAFAHTGGLVGAEVGVAGGTAVLAQRVLEAVFGDDAVRRLAKKAKDDLDARVEGLLAGELSRFHAALDGVGVEAGAGGADPYRRPQRRRGPNRRDAPARPDGGRCGRAARDRPGPAGAGRPAAGGRADGRSGRRRGAPVKKRSTLPERLAALRTAMDAARGRIDPDVEERDRRDPHARRRQARVLGRRDDRRPGRGDGSGKSSLFNATVRHEAGRAGVRRPTTAAAMAAVFGEEQSDLLDWLDVPRRHLVTGAEDLSGLILLDLPDHDSTQQSHREIVDRLVELVDQFVWVVDPQKYADAALHDRYLKPLAAHADVMVIALNQIDRVPRQHQPGMVARPAPVAGRRRTRGRTAGGGVGT